jgi:hypothetical protein
MARYSDKDCVKHGTCNFEIMNDCTYLGTFLTNKNELRPKIEKKNYKCHMTILCTGSPTTKSVSFQSRKK